MRAEHNHPAATSTTFDIHVEQMSQVEQTPPFPTQHLPPPNTPIWFGTKYREGGVNNQRKRHVPPNNRTAVTRYSQARTTYNEQNQNERAVTQITRLHHTVMYGNINTLKHQVVHALLHGSNDNNTTTHAAKLPERTDKRKKEEVQILTKLILHRITFTFTFKQ